MADGLLSSALGFIDRQKQAAKAGLGLLASNPQEWLTQTTARYLPTRAEEQQYRAVQQAGGDITQTPYYQKLFDLAQFQSSLKPLSKTQFQVANEVAQKNAVEMLGLPPDNTAMDRARAMGFNTPAYRGTTANEIMGKDRNFVSENKDIANEYAGYLKDWADDPKMLEAMMKLTPSGNVMPLLVKDAAKAKARTNVPDYEMILDANQARSRFAAFDPARVNESDLLAAGIPIGLLGSTQVELPKNKQKKQK